MMNVKGTWSGVMAVVLAKQLLVSQVCLERISLTPTGRAESGERADRNGSRRDHCDSLVRLLAKLEPRHLGLAKQVWTTSFGIRLRAVISRGF